MEMSGGPAQLFEHVLNEKERTKKERHWQRMRYFLLVIDRRYNFFVSEHTNH